MGQISPHVFSWSNIRDEWSAIPAWLLLLGGLLFFSPLLEGGTTHAAVMIIRLVILLLVADYLRGIIQARRMVVPASMILYVVAAFLALAAISTALAPYRHQSLQWLIVLLSYGALLYVLLGVIDTWRQAAWALVLLVLMGLFEAGLTVVQAWWWKAPRPSGTFANPNFLAGYLTAVWCVLLSRLLYGRIGRGGWNKHILSFPIALPMAVAALTLLATTRTGSRGGLLALVAGTAVVVAFRFGRKGLLAGALLIGIVLSVPNPLSDRIRAEHSVNPVGYARWQMWERAAHQIAKHPLGVGLGLYQYTYPQNAFPIEGRVARYGYTAQTPHSEYVQIAVEMGVPAILVFGWGIAHILSEMRNALAGRLRRWQRGLVVGVSGAWTTIMVHAAVDSNLHEPAIVIVLILFTTILLSAKRLSQPDMPRRTVLIRHPIVWGACAAIGLVLATALVTRLGVAWLAFEAGSHALERKNLERAVEYLGQAVELDPGKTLYRSSKAAAYFHLFQQTRSPTDLAVVVDELKRESALNPLSARPFKLLGDIYASDAPGAAGPDQRSALLQQAVAAYEQAVEREPFNPYYQLELGRIYLASGDGDKAERLVRGAVEMEPNFLPGRLWLATRYAKTDRLEPAKQEYEEILRRQRYYAGWIVEAYEKSFLNVDVRELAVLLERSGHEIPKKRRSS